MSWFFTEFINGNTAAITGEDALHIEKALRMKVGEELTLCDAKQMEHSCKITDISQKQVVVKILESNPCENEPNLEVTLYQALTKGDKMDTIVQKAVELGATTIVPVLTRRCVSRPDEKSIQKKCTRWQKIAKQAAQQSRRGIIPTVKPLLTLQNAIKDTGHTDCKIVFYENGGESINQIIPKDCGSLSFFIGPEGGFEKDEIKAITKSGGKSATLGKRILRAETAPLAALSIIMYQTDNFS